MKLNGDVALILSCLRRWFGESAMMAYLAMMAIRLLELRRVLKTSGSLYLHCDPTASHYLKILLDAIFDHDGWRNEIMWRRTPFSGSSKARAQQLPRSHDVIHFYTLGKEWTWNPPTMPYKPEYLARFNAHAPLALSVIQYRFLCWHIPPLRWPFHQALKLYNKALAKLDLILPGRS